MSWSSDEIEVDDSWKVDLEIALLEDADIFRIRSICSNRPLPKNSRPEVWRLCLQPDLQAPAMAEFHEVFGLPNQSQLHSDCTNAAEQIILRLNNRPESTAAPIRHLSDSDETHSEPENETLDAFLDAVAETNDTSPLSVPSVSQLASDFESVLTHFAQTYALSYCPQRGWVEMIRLLYETLRPVDRPDLYGCFAALYHRFVPSGSDVDLSHAFRILLQYHEPKLCNLLDSLKLHPETYASQWLCSLFIKMPVDEKVLLSLWDVNFLVSDPLLGLYIVLVLLMNLKTILFAEHKQDSTGDALEETEEEAPELKKFEHDKVLQLLMDLPKPMQVDDLSSLIELTQLFASHTPTSFRTKYVPLLFGNQSLSSHFADTGITTMRSLCMSVSVHEVLEAQSVASKESTPDSDLTESSNSTARYLVVDCRPADQYNAGHLHTAFFLDSELLLSEPDQFEGTVKALLLSQKRALDAGSEAAGEHITVLGSGLTEDERIVNLVISAFLRLHTPYVSRMDGGFMSLHDIIGPNGRGLANHESSACLCCKGNPTQASKEGRRLLERFKPNVAPKISSHTQPTSTRSNSTFGNLLTKLSNTVLKASPPAPTNAKPNAAAHVTHVQPKVLNTKSQASCPSTGPASYRNTSSVFSIEDDLDEDDDEELNAKREGNVVASQSMANSPGSMEQTPSPKSSWLRRISAIVTSPNEKNPIPEGDQPARPGGLDDYEPGDLVDTTQWTSRQEVRGVFDCQLVDRANGRLAEQGYLVLVERHLLLLLSLSTSSTQLVSSLGSAIHSVLGRSPSGRVGKSSPQTTSRRHATVVRSVPLDLVTRITANRRMPECITFHYSNSDPADVLRLNGQVMGTRDRLYIPQAGEAVRMVKLAIYNTTMQE